MLPETRTTLPNSPMQRANVSSAPPTIAGRMAGNTTFRNVVQAPAPSVAAASSSAGIELQEHRLDLADDERQRDDAQGQQDPDRRERRPGSRTRSRTLPIGAFGP